ncbi:hypothetical protein PS398_00110 [Limosilactobacillus pontis]
MPTRHRLFPFFQKGDPYGFWLTFIISIVIALATAYYLNHKEYTD